MANRFWDKFNQGLETGTKIWNADSERRMRAEIAAANAMKPEAQSLGVNAPAAGQVPVGYENYIQANEGGGFIPRQEEGLAPDQLSQRQTMAERFSAPNAFAGEKTQYTLGGTTQPTAFTPDDIARARMENKANIYSNYGKEDLAETMRTNALARESAGLQIKKMKTDLTADENFKRDQEIFATESSKALQAADAANQLLQQGDRVGAARVIADFRTGINDNRLMRITEDGRVEGSENGGKTWKVAEGFDLNRPGTVEGMLGQLKNTIDERGKSLLGKHVKTTTELMKLIELNKDEAFKNHQMKLAEKELIQKEDLFNRGLISAKELNDAKNKTSLKAAEISASRSAYPSVGKYGTYNGEPVNLDAHSGKLLFADGTALSRTEAKDVKPLASVEGKGLQMPAEMQAKLWDTAESMVNSDPNAKNMKPAEKLSKIKELFGTLMNKSTLDAAFGSNNAGGLEPSATVKNLPRNPYNVTKPANQVNMSVVTDPLTGESMDAQEYHRKYGQWPADTGLMTRLLGD